MFFFSVWSEDMDAAKPASLMVVGRRAGLSEDEVNKCIQVSYASFMQFWANNFFVG